jgi:hypothetical protein
VVPASYHGFFNGCASVAGALIGLLFVALSVSPGKLTGADASTEHQIRAAAAFSALVNTLVVALSAQLPGTSLGDVGIALGAAGLASTTGLAIVLYREHMQKIGRADIRMLAILAVLYGLQLANAVQLNGSSSITGGVSREGWLLIFFFLFGIARSWHLAGARSITLTSTVTAMHRPAVQDRPAGTGGPDA